MANALATGMIAKLANEMLGKKIWSQAETSEGIHNHTETMLTAE